MTTITNHKPLPNQENTNLQQQKIKQIICVMKRRKRKNQRTKTEVFSVVDHCARLTEAIFGGAFQIFFVDAQ